MPTVHARAHYVEYSLTAERHEHCDACLAVTRVCPAVPCDPSLPLIGRLGQTAHRTCHQNPLSDLQTNTADDKTENRE